MRRIWLLTALVFLSVLTFGQANASKIFTTVSPEVGPDTVMVGEPFTIDLQVIPDNAELAGGSIPLFFYSPDGSIENVVHRNVSGVPMADGRTGAPIYDSSITMTTEWANTFVIFKDWFGFSWDGSLPDTLNHTIAAIFGLPASADTNNFADIALQINEVGTFCIDSCSIPGVTPAGKYDWLFDDPTMHFGGPYCFTVYHPDSSQNQAPVIDPIGNKEGDEGELIEFTVTASDADGDAIQLATSILPSGAGFTDNGDGTGLFSWTPTYDQAGVYAVTFYALDGKDVASEDISITVNDVDRPPVLTVPGAQSTDENVLLTFDVSATDPDGTTPVMTTGTLPAGAGFADNGDGTGTFTWTPTYDQADVYTVMFYAADASNTDSATVEITVNDVDRAPVLTVPGAQSTDENVLLTFDVSATDPDGTTPVMTAGTMPAGAGFADNGDGTGTFTWTPTFDQAEVYTVMFYAADASNTDSGTVEITVNNVNRAPVLDQVAAGPQFVDEGMTLVLAVSASDPDGTIPVLTAENVMPNAELVDNGDGTGTFTFNPDTSQAGDYVVTFIASDGALADSEVVAIFVNDVQPDIELVVDDTPRSYTFIEGDGVSDSVLVEENYGRNIDFTLSGAEGWLVVPAVNYTTPDYGDYSISTTGLTPGDYFDTLFVTAGDAVNSPIGIPIDLTVIAAVDTQLVATPPSFEFTLTEGDSLMDSVTITENNELTIQFEMANNSSWLTLPVFITPPSTPATIEFGVISAGLEPGVYYDTITAVPVSDDKATGISVPVMLTVEELIEPELVVEPAFFEFTVEYGESLMAADSVYVYELNGLADTFWTTSQSNWLYLDTVPVSPLVTPKKFAVDIYAAGLAPGVYVDTIGVYSYYATNSPVFIPVTLTVHADYAIETTPTEFNFTLEPGQMINETLMVEEIFGRNVEFDTWNTEIWLNVEPDMAGPYMTPKGLDIIVTDSGMIPGNTYYDTIRINSTAATPEFPQAEVMVTVDFVEPAPVILTEPDSFTFTLEQGAVAENNALVVYEEHGQNVPFMYDLMLGSSWLEFVPPTVTVFPETPDSVMFDINTDGLAIGAYSDTIIIYDPIDSPGVMYAPVKVPVVLFVTEPQPLLAAIPGYFDVTLDLMDSLWLASYIYSPVGDTIPFWPIVKNGSDWLVLPDEGQMRYSPDSMLFMVNSFGLTEGYYADTIEIYDTVPDTVFGEPVLIIPVIMHVKGAPPPVHVMTWPDRFNWTVNQGDMVYDSLYVYDTSGQNVEFIFFNQESWLTIEPFGMPPYTTPYSLIVSANTVSLMPGVYHDTVIIESPFDTPEFSTVYVPVMLTVEGPVEMADSVWMPAVPAVPGNMVTVPVYFRNFDPLSAIHLPLMWNSGSVMLNSITFDDTRVEYVDSKPTAIDNDTWHAEIAILPTFEPDVPVGRGLLAKLNFEVLPGATESEVTIDTSSFFTGYPLTFINSDLDIITPTFVAGRILIDTAAAMVCGRVIDDKGNEIEGATVELWDDFPGGGVLLSEMTDINGQFLCHANSIFPFDAYAYKEGYYPGLVEDIEFNEIGFDIVLTKTPDITWTTEWVNFYCGDNWFYNVPLPVGSVVDAYDPDGILCGSWPVTEAGKYGFMPVYRDDIYTIEDEGAEPGDEISFFINGYPANAVGDRTWTENGDTSEVCLDIYTVETKTIALNTGWNLISWNVDTPVDEIETLLGSISDCVEVVLGFEGGGYTYAPALPEFSTLMSADHYHGYWLKMTCPATLSLTGVPVAATTPIELETGWNLVSYLPNLPDTTPNALGSVYDNLIVALGFDGEGRVWDPSVAPEYSDLQHMYPGYGYWVKMMQPDMLVYPGVGPSVVFRQQFAGAAKATPVDAVASRQWINIYSHELTLDGETVPMGAEIEVVASDGSVVGTGVVAEGGRFGFVPVYGDDPLTSEAEGLRSGERFGLVIDGVGTNETFAWTIMGDMMEIDAVTAKPDDNLLPSQFGLGQNYPNPFNPTTRIAFSVPQAMPATIEIYNILGKKINTVFDGMAEAGRNEVIWDGTTEDGDVVASGLYFYRMKAGSFETSRKMVLMK